MKLINKALILINILMIGCVSTEVIDSTEDYTQRILLSSILKIGSGDSGTSVTELLGAPTVIAKNASGNEIGFIHVLKYTKRLGLTSEQQLVGLSDRR
tara:strand:+ start:314 stop:607 length:294 start_codon:yes stop_codon:yes gene_type:complete